MYRTLIVPLDGSTLAERAVPLAVALAKANTAGLSLVRAHEVTPLDWGAGGWSGGIDPLDSATRDDEQQYLDQVAAGLRATRSVPIEQNVVNGAPADVISKLANRTPNSLIVMSTHGRTGFSRFWLGSVADAVVRHTIDPVLLVRGNAEPAAGARIAKILVPLDGSPFGEAVLSHAVTIAKAMKASITLVHVVHPVIPTLLVSVPTVTPPVFDPSELETETGAARAHGEEYVTRVAADWRRSIPDVEFATEVRVDANAAASILESAKAHGTDLIALSTHGVGASRMLMGSVADKVLRGGSGATLLIRPNARPSGS